MKSRTRLWGGPPLLLLLLTGLLLLIGCGSDRPVMGPPPDQPHPIQADTPLTAGPSETAASTSPAVSGPPDPLIGDSRQTRPDPLLRNDPLIGHDPQVGRGMPTQHSHWLRGRLRDARVTVLLNGVWYGSFSGTVDRDITMSLRQGTNTVTFECQPSTAGATADMEVVESEHHPPIPPLATFHSRSGSDTGVEAADAGPLKAVTQTSPFMAN